MKLEKGKQLKPQLEMAKTCDDSHAGVPDLAPIISVTVEGRISSQPFTLFAITHAVVNNDGSLGWALDPWWGVLKGRWNVLAHALLHLSLVGGLNLHSELSEVCLDVDHLCRFLPCGAVLHLRWSGSSGVRRVFIVECFLQCFIFGQ